jgi:hypothetical protein
LRTQSDTNTITQAVNVAAGVFAPGHLGELTQYLPFELVDDILAQTKTVQRRLRDLPSRAGVYFLLALGMYPRLGYARVWAKLTAGLAGLAVPSPSEKALRDLRRRLGPAPRGCASAGCARSPSTAATRSRSPTPAVTAGGWAGSGTGWALPGYPTLRLMALAETGTLITSPPKQVCTNPRLVQHAEISALQDTRRI